MKLLKFQPWFLLVLLSLKFTTVVNAAPAAPAPYKSPIYAQAKVLIDAKDFLGFRVWVRKTYSQKLRHVEWYDIKNLITAYANKSGFDLIPFWNLRNPKGKSEVDFSLEKADALMLSGKFEDSFEELQKTAKKLKKIENSRYEARKLLPYVFHSMGRALYGAKRFDEALVVYQWIGPNYPFFRQVLFEKMWSAFKAGRVDLALGAVASQRSSYFSKYLLPESYMIQTYLYKKLCREDDLKQVVAEMKEYEDHLKKDGISDWVANDVETLTLWHLANSPELETDVTKMITKEERDREKKQIKEALNLSYEKKKIKILNDLKVAFAYTHLAKVTNTKDVLKPVSELKSRDELLKRDLEVWPADSTEDWIDELGKHVLIGDSLCK